MRNILIVLAFVVVAGGIVLSWPRIESLAFKPAQPVACTAEAKLCPDGSAVGRTGPDCEFASCPAESEIIATSTDLTLGVGQKGKVGDVEITFNTVVQDSRCAVDVQCIQAGSVTVSALLSYNSLMSTQDISSSAAPVAFGDRSISIVNVAPVKMSKTTILPNAYQITFRVLTK